MEYSIFLSLHESQLQKSGVPEKLWTSLHKKLVGEIYDAGNYVGLFRVEDEDENDDEKDQNESKEEVRKSHVLIISIVALLYISVCVMCIVMKPNYQSVLPLLPSSIPSLR